MQTHKDLIVWQKSIDFVVEIYKATKCFPKEEVYGLTSQIRRAAVSIPSNIAEGSSRKTEKDQAHFYTTAFSSLVELLNQLILSVDLEFLQEDKYLVLREKIEHISNQLNQLRKSTQR